MTVFSPCILQGTVAENCVNPPCEPPKCNGGEKTCCGFRAGILRRN